MTEKELPRSLQVLPGEIMANRATVDSSNAKFVVPPEDLSLDEAELSFVQQAIERSGGNQTRAAVRKVPLPACEKVRILLHGSPLFCETSQH